MTVTIQVVGGVQPPRAYLTGFECPPPPSPCCPSQGRSKWGQVTRGRVVTLAPTPGSELECWPQGPVFRCLLCIWLNLGRVPEPPAINYLSPSSREATVTTQRCGGGCSALPGLGCWGAVLQSPCHSAPRSRGSGTWGAWRHDVQMRGRSLFSAKSSPRL